MTEKFDQDVRTAETGSVRREFIRRSSGAQRMNNRMAEKYVRRNQENLLPTTTSAMQPEDINASNEK